MAVLRQALLVTAGFVLVQAYILLRLVLVDNKPNSYFIKQQASLQHVVKVTSMDNFKGRHPISVDGNGSSFDTLTAKDILGRSARAKTTVSQIVDLCDYKVQVYDRDNQYAKKRAALKCLVQNSKGGSAVRADVQCSKKCVIEVTIADGRNNFTGMDAVIFHFNRDITPNPAPPVDMNPNQTWIYVSWESPWSNKGEPSLKRAHLTANALWTYHRASDITTPYGFYKPGIPTVNETKTPDEWLQGKTRMTLWMASNCKSTSWPRERFVRQLKTYIQVDVYGACGNLQCQPRWSATCKVHLVRQYKFYLSLENSECEDYITEKVWDKPLTQGVVPIVYGPKRKVYEELLPPNSFIYIGDFKNIKDLADYLKMLDSHPEMYARYLEWQYKGSIGIPRPAYGRYDPTLFCNLLPILTKGRSGQVSRTPVLEGSFSQTCRKLNESKNRKTSGFGLGNWNPW